MYRPRIGHIGFLNVLPLTYGYKKNFSAEIDLTDSVPAVVNEKMKNNLLDVSLISSIEYARQSKNLVMLPNFCVRADDEVTSIILVSRKPIEKLDGEKISITAKSATAHCLLKIILQEGYKISPVYDVKNLTLEKLVPNDSAAALFIGDDALKIFLHKKENFLYYDLGHEWKKMTGKQMVYAVFAAQKSFAENYSGLLQNVCQKISQGFDYGLKNKTDAINSVLDEKNFTFDELNNYLGNVIKWNLTDEGIDALKTFYQFAHKINLLEEVPEIVLKILR
ncbi:MAG: menaquinone biosynthesis protein [Selenomonadaceae bacterium]|nr:menaquinone biosynthesis protein [Selenomonadaceae bacterium]